MFALRIEYSLFILLSVRYNCSYNLLYFEFYEFARTLWNLPMTTEYFLRKKT